MIPPVESDGITINIALRKAVVRLRQRGYSVRNIARMVGRHPSRIGQVVLRLRKTGAL